MRKPWTWTKPQPSINLLNPKRTAEERNFLSIFSPYKWMNAVHSHPACSLCMYVCVFVSVGMCVFPPLHSVLSPPEHRGAQRRDSGAQQLRVRVACFFLPLLSGASRKQTARWRFRSPASCLFLFLFFPLSSRLGSSHAAVEAPLDRGRFVTDQAAARWIWRASGTQTPSPLRYLPLKLNSRFLVGEYELLQLHGTETRCTILWVIHV